MPSESKPTAVDGWRREAVRVVLAMSTAAGTVFASVRSAINDHESRIGQLESRQSVDEDKTASRQELEAHWSAITAQLSRIDQDIRDLRFEVHAAGACAAQIIPIVNRGAAFITVGSSRFAEEG